MQVPARLFLALFIAAGGCAPPPSGPLERRADLPEVDLIINLGVEPQVGVVGEALHFGARIDNGGPETATGAVVAFDMPDGLSFVPVGDIADGCEDTGVAIECPVGDVAVGDEVFVSFDSVPAEVGTYHAEGRVFTLEGSDTATGNNLGMLDVEVREEGNDAYADLSMRIEAESSTGRAGRAFPIQFVINNAGPAIAEDVLLHASFGGPLDLDELGLATASCQIAVDELLCQLGDILPSAFSTVEVNVLPNGGGILTVDATAETALIDDPVPGDNSFSVSYEILDSGPAEGVDLGLSLAVEPEVIELDDTFDLTITLANFGLSPASDAVARVNVSNLVSLGSELGEGSACQLFGSNLECSYATLPAGGVMTEVITWTGDNAGTVGMDGAASATEDDEWPPDNSAYVEVTVVPPGNVDFTDLAVTSTPEPAEGVVGDPLILFLDVENLGQVDATGVVVYDYLPPETEIVAARVGETDCEVVVNEVSCAIGELAAQATAQATIIVLPPSSGTFTHNVLVTLDQVDSVASNNTVVQEIPIAADGAPRQADIAVGLVAERDTAAVGESLTYELTLLNQGPDIASAPLLEFDLPGAVTLQAVDISQGACQNAGGVVSCDIGILGPDGEAIATITALPTSPGALTFVATGSSLEADPDEGNNSASASAVVSPRAAPQLSAALAPTPLANVASPGERGVMMAAVSLAASDAQDIVISRLTVAASGSGSDNHDIQQVTVYADSDGDGEPDDSASPLSSGTFGLDDGELTLPLSSPIGVEAGGATSLLILYDLEEEISHTQAPGASWPRRPTLPGWPAMLVGFFGLVWAARQRKLATGLAGATLLSLCLSCSGPGSNAATPIPRTYTLTVTAITGLGTAYNEEADIDGLPIEGATISLQR